MIAKIKVIHQIEQAIAQYSQSVLEADEAAFDKAPASGKWSKKQILGHLCDSAHNNLRRFVVGQYQEGDKIVYDQDLWVSANDYQSMSKTEVLHLWVVLNRQICRVLNQLPDDKLDNRIDTGKGGVSMQSIAWLADDYCRHMQHHLQQLTA